MPKTSQVTRATRAMSIVAGLKKRFPASEPIKVNGKPYSRAELIALFQEQIEALDRIRVARIALGTAVAEERAVARRTTKLTLALKWTVRHVLGMTRVSFADFGWALPKKRGPKTLAGKLSGIEKARATRLARAKREA